MGTLRSPEEQQIVDLLKVNETLRRRITELSGNIQWLLPDDIGSKIWNTEYVARITAYLVTFYGEPDSPQTLAESLGLELPVQEGTSDELKAKYAIELITEARTHGKSDDLFLLVMDKFRPLLSGDASPIPTFHPKVLGSSGYLRELNFQKGYKQQ